MIQRKLQRLWREATENKVCLLVQGHEPQRGGRLRILTRDLWRARAHVPARIQTPTELEIDVRCLSELLSPHFLRPVLSLNLELIKWLDRSPHHTLFLPDMRLQIRAHALAFYMTAEDQNPGPHA